MQLRSVIAFLTVIIVWGTTPLVIQISALSASPLFSASTRMTIGVLICVIILWIKDNNLAIKQSWRNYLIAGSGIYITLSLVYISSTHIDSGIIAIIFAITPLITGISANFIFANREFNTHKLLATLLGISGIIVIFFDYNNLKIDSFYLFLLFIAMAFQSFISVKLKSLNSNNNALQTTTGGLLFSLPFFIISFLSFEEIPLNIDIVFIWSTLYLAIFGSVLGFISYYYLIKNSSVLSVGIIPLITPILALILAFYFNEESLTFIQIIGMFIVLIALIYFQFYAKITKLR